MANLSFWRPLVIGSIRGSIKKSPIVENSLCPFSPMQHWFVYLTISHESNWGPSAWTISVCFDRETAKWSSGEEVPPDEWWALLNICQGYFKKYWKPWAWWKDDIASINLSNSKHSREAENTVLLDAKNFLGDIDSITLNETSTNVSDHVAGCICHKETETIWRMLRSTSLVWWTK